MILKSAEICGCSEGRKGGRRVDELTNPCALEVPPASPLSGSDGPQSLYFILMTLIRVVLLSICESNG